MKSSSVITALYGAAVGVLVAAVLVVALSSNLSAEPLTVPTLSSTLSPKPSSARGYEPVASIEIHSPYGVHLCSGVPIADSSWVATAAHCFPPEVTRIEIAWRGTVYTTRTWVVHPEYEPSVPAGSVYDVAFIRSEVHPFTSARIGDDSPVRLGYVEPDVPLIVLGYQSDGYDEPSMNHLSPSGRQVARCDATSPGLDNGTVFFVACGLVPGASGGPVLMPVDNGYVLAGVISTVADDDHNGMVPASHFAAALAAPLRYGTASTTWSSEYPQNQPNDSWHHANDVWKD
jgi:hypothetical protein